MGEWSEEKNVLGTIMHSFAILCLVSVIWVVWGYTLSFGRDIGGVIGSLEWLGLSGVGIEPAPLAGTVTHLIFMMFQGMFAIITPALITGAFAERIKFSALMLFTIFWVTFVYSPLCHWVWGGGWIGTKLGALDFAGGTVVHINSAVAALAAIVIMGKRRDYKVEPMMPHNHPMTILGAGLLWFGWFGFNAGSALSSNGLASLAFVTTNTASGSAAMTKEARGRCGRSCQAVGRFNLSHISNHPAHNLIDQCSGRWYPSRLDSQQRPLQFITSANKQIQREPTICGEGFPPLRKMRELNIIICRSNMILIGFGEFIAPDPRTMRWRFEHER